jgi:hypothetical protein
MRIGEESLPNGESNFKSGRVETGTSTISGGCAHCNLEMKISYSELDRKIAIEGYTVENTELVHAECHRSRQAAKGYR